MTEEEERIEITTGPPEVYFLHEIAARLADGLRIAPFSAIIWDNKLIKPNATAVIDTSGYTAITLYLQVDNKAEIILEAVSRDSAHWRRVYESLFIFYLPEPDYVFLNLDVTLKNRAALRYRYLKIRLVAEEEVKMTLEITSKAIPVPKLGPGIYGLPSWNKISPARQIEIIHEYTRPVIPEITIVTPEIIITPPSEPALIIDEEIVDKLNLIQTYLYDSQWSQLTEIRNSLANADKWDHFHKTVTSALTPVDLSSLAIPDGCQLVVKSKGDNTGAIYLGKSEAAVIDEDKRVTLSKKNESTTFKVNNANLVWVDVEVDGEGVEYWSEKK